jgi:TRAP-type C4-dicarboxylate transport system substrate-binding protein
MLTFTSRPSSAAAPAPANQIVWRMDFYLPAQDLETILLQQACDDILEYTGGRLKIEVYPSFSLKLNPGTQLTNIRDGLCEAACMTVQALEGQEPSLAVTEAAGVWPSKEDQPRRLTLCALQKESLCRGVEVAVRGNQNDDSTNKRNIQRQESHQNPR